MIILAIDPGPVKSANRTRLQDGTYSKGHGMDGTPEHNSWRAIIQRCENPRCKCFPAYGGRGITLSPEWRHSFAAFFEHVGPRPTPNHTIDRIDNEKHYEPGNVKWSTKVEQNRNRRDSVILTYDNRSMNLIAWAHHLGIGQPTLWARLNRHGWSVERALGTPVNKPAHGGYA